MDQETKELAVIDSSQMPEAFQNWMQGSPVFNQLSQLASKFAKSDLTPEQFRGKEADCFIALQIAHRMRIDPFLTLQNLIVVRGRPTWAAQFVIAQANERGPFASRIKFKTTGSGSDLAVTAYATLKDTGEAAEATVSMKMAIDEGWAGKNPKYKSMPEQMLSYRAGVFLVRKFAPELMIGMPTREEVEDFTLAQSRDVSAQTNKLEKKIKEAKDGKEKTSDFI